MRGFIKVFLTVCFCTFLGCKALGQKFTTHSVKQNETLYSIAKQYGVSQEEILKYNKELKNGASLSINTILVIPSSSGAVTNTKPNQKEKGQVANGEVAELVNRIMNDSVAKREPIGFVEHKVKKKETLYGIAKEYGVTEEEIKKYNTQLYAAQLDRKMVIRIPKYRKPTEPQNTIDIGDFEKYIVAPKETRWSIAHKYGITIDSMLVLNPSLSKTSNYLQEGYELLLPRIAGSTVENQETQLFTSYTVPPKMNFYRLEKEFGVKSDEVVRLNPEITERGGLKEGMVIRLPERRLDPGEINTDNYIFYEVKPKQNEFRLTRKFGMSWEELIQLNPELRDGLKAGMVLKLPKNQVGDFEVRNSLVLDKINLLDSINVENRPKIMFLLPFRLDKLDLNDAETVEWTIQNRNSLKYSLGLYSGALVALDSIKSLGVSVDVKTFDNRLDLQRTKEILQRENLGSYNAIFGPLDVLSLKEASTQAASYNLPVIAPVPAKSDISLGNVFFSYTPEETLREHLLKFISDKREDENIIIIADAKNRIVKDSILSKFPSAKLVTVKEEEENIGINRDKLEQQLSNETENWVFVESDNFKLISSVVSILNSFHNSVLEMEDPKAKKIRVRMFTTDKNNAFDNDVISSTHLSNLRFTYPSVYREAPSDAFERRYKAKYGVVPERFAVRGFDVTFDLLLKLAYKNDLLDVSKFIGETQYSGSKFDYEKDISSGYFNKASYIMGYENMYIKELE
ncbi:MULTISPECIES: LysM peptidoglycan-binding domain-containing protein [Maribacter]|uniref:LysM peptidoglycan-binding domain-containing protein n=1 Tax=Maribacter flavus TaxID=1658664 RepID=A0ABU7ILL5_9FLAO|nr:MULTISPECIES: LysM peptidoglycan-binding domain-containing protein [Maribacter]MDC6406707.1 LysM peptidoglycan-binding domain-containing protein [Maribacter sp. PR66]MEE1973851.1 LysM peptidoglycan-binding domain-containing protein [Maribacter flavus]